MLAKKTELLLLKDLVKRHRLNSKRLLNSNWDGGYIHFREAELLAENIIDNLKSIEGVYDASVTSDARRKIEVIKPLEILVATESKAKIIQFVAKNEEFVLDKKNSGPLSLKFTFKPLKAEVNLIFTTKDQFINELFKTTAHPKHLNIELEKGGPSIIF